MGSHVRTAMEIMRQFRPWLYGGGREAD